MNDARAKGMSSYGGEGLLPQIILKSLCSETPFLAFWEDTYCLKHSLNQLSFLCLFLFAWLLVQVLNFIVYFVFLYKIYILTIHLKISEQMSQRAKKVIFTACHSGKMKLTFTSPNIISTSPKNVLTSRSISQFFCNLNSSTLLARWAS